MTDLVECLRAWAADMRQYESSTEQRAANAFSEAAARIEKLEKALREMAAYDDKHASSMLSLTGSYGRFDEPYSVEIARKALEE